VQYGEEGIRDVQYSAWGSNGGEISFVINIVAIKCLTELNAATERYSLVATKQIRHIRKTSWQNAAGLLPGSS
jgi:hypothetical protein